MLTASMQIQAIADRLAGIPVQADAREFDMPWKLCWQALEAAQAGQGAQALQSATCQAGQPAENPGEHPGSAYRLASGHPVIGRHCFNPGSDRMGLGWLDSARIDHCAASLAG